PPSAGEDASQAEGGDTLVIDTAFSLETGDPGRTYVPTGNMVLHAVDDTRLTFEGPDEELPDPALAPTEQHVPESDFTLTLAGDGGRRRLLARAGPGDHQAEGELPQGRHHRGEGRRGDGQTLHRGALPAAARDRDEPGARDRQLRARPGERRHDR